MNAKMSAVDWNDVALFVEVVRSQSFSEAARTNGVPVSTVSRRVARLEGRLGARLLERTTRRLRLTDLGTRYLEHAERAIDELTEAGRFVRAQQAVPRGRVRLTAPIGLGPALASALAPYVAATPLVAIEIDLTERRVDLVAEGVDIALRAGAADANDYVAKKLYASSRGLFASRAYLARRGRPKRVSDLTTHDLVATRTSPAGATWELVDADAPQRTHRLAFRPRFVVSELVAAKAAVAAGIGIGLLPTGQVERGTLERVLPKLGSEPGGLWLLYPAHRNLTAAVRSCADHLLATLK